MIRFMYARVQNTEKIMYGHVTCELKPMKCNIEVKDELTVVVRHKEDRNLITDTVKEVCLFNMFVGDHVEVNGVILGIIQMEALAKSLGFLNHMELMVYVWDQWGLPFQGKLVKW